TGSSNVLCENLRNLRFIVRLLCGSPALWNLRKVCLALFRRAIGLDRVWVFFTIVGPMVPAAVGICRDKEVAPGMIRSPARAQDAGRLRGIAPSAPVSFRELLGLLRV